MIEYFNINDEENATCKILGNGMQKSLFVVYSSEYENHKDKLETIIKALALDTIKDIIVLVLNDGSFSPIFSAIEKYGINKIVSFGITLSDLFPNIDVQNYQVIRTEYYSWLTAPQLNSILSDQNEKKKLWNALKYQFKVQ